MSFRDFVASHTGRHFFDAFREFVAAFKTYVGHLTLHNQMMQAHLNQKAAEFQQEVEAVDANTPDVMPCVRCQTVCGSSVSVMLGWRGAVSLLCVACAKDLELINDSKAN